MRPSSLSFPYALIVHGGAGVVSRDQLLPDQEARIHAELLAALTAGQHVLVGGGTATDAVAAAVCYLEDCPLFNAGRGSVLNREGVCEMDAAIMEGRERRAGAVAAVKRVRNPVRAALAVMDRSPHVLLAAEGADHFAAECGLPLEPPQYFVTEARRQQWIRVNGQRPSPGSDRSLWALERKTDAFGTVGAVAWDHRGNLAAATSTGGLAAKAPGRVGDSPIIGAGTYADNATCAVSATGHGEHFIREVVAHSVAARIRYQNQSLASAAADTIHRELAPRGGNGGLIAIDRTGHITAPFNTPGMYRAWVSNHSPARTAIYPDHGHPD